MLILLKSWDYKDLDDLKVSLDLDNISLERDIEENSE